MASVLQKSYQSFRFLFVLNWDVLLSFGVTTLALAAGAYLAASANILTF